MHKKPSTQHTNSFVSQRKMATALSLLTRRVAHSFRCRSKSTTALSRSLSSEASHAAEALGKTDKKRLDVAIVGAPNAGKSQLLNVMTKSTVAAVSRKRHTTRGGILGARTLDDTTQLVFWDTPGFMQHEAARHEGLERDLMISAAEEMENVDYSLLVIDAARVLTDHYKESIVTLMNHALGSDGREEAVFDEDYVPDQPVEAFGIVLNKVDLVHPKDRLLELADELGNMAEACIVHYLEHAEEPRCGSLEDIFPPVFYTNAREAEGIDDILNHLKELATPCMVWAVESGQTTIMTPLERVEEVIREKIYRTLHQEIPHAVRQVNRGYVQRAGGIVEIQQDLVVKSKSHYSIIAGRSLATIQQTAQRELEKSVFTDMKVVLRLHLKLNKGQHDRFSQANMQGTVEFRPRR